MQIASLLVLRGIDCEPRQAQNVHAGKPCIGVRLEDLANGNVHCVRQCLLAGGKIDCCHDDRRLLELARDRLPQ